MAGTMEQGGLCHCHTHYIAIQTITITHRLWISHLQTRAQLTINYAGSEASTGQSPHSHPWWVVHLTSLSSVAMAGLAHHRGTKKSPFWKFCSHWGVSKVANNLVPLVCDHGPDPREMCHLVNIIFKYCSHLATPEIVSGHNHCSRHGWSPFLTLCRYYQNILCCLTIAFQTFQPKVSC